jgi:hypothetical protein
VEVIERAGPRGEARHWLEEWRKLLEGPAERLLEALTARTPHSRELRQSSPFAGVLVDAVRDRVLEAHREEVSRS